MWHWTVILSIFLTIWQPDRIHFRETSWVFKIVTNLSLCWKLNPTLILNDLNLMEGKCFFYKITAVTVGFFLPLVLHTPERCRRPANCQNYWFHGGADTCSWVIYHVHHINRTCCISTTIGKTHNTLKKKDLTFLLIKGLLNSFYPLLYGFGLAYVEVLLVIWRCLFLVFNYLALKIWSFILFSDTNKIESVFSFPHDCLWMGWEETTLQKPTS